MKRIFEFVWSAVILGVAVYCSVIILDDMSRLLADREPVTEPRPQFGTLPPDCKHLYNVGQSEAWADCMGVGLVSPAAKRELRDAMLRDDL